MERSTIISRTVNQLFQWAIFIHFPVRFLYVKTRPGRWFLLRDWLKLGPGPRKSNSIISGPPGLPPLSPLPRLESDRSDPRLQRGFGQGGTSMIKLPVILVNLSNVHSSDFHKLVNQIFTTSPHHSIHACL